MTGQSTPIVRVGCAGTPPRMSRDKLLASLDFLEEAFLTKADAVPTAKVLRRWRASAPDRTGFVLVGGEGLFGGEAARAKALADLDSAASALRPEVLLLRPPSGHAPSQTNRDAFRALPAAIAEQAGLAEVGLVLWPRGLWDTAVCTPLADELGLAIAFDPLGNDPLEEIPGLLARAIERGSAYLRPDRVGTPRVRVDPFELETLAAMIEAIGRCWVSFAHSERARDGHALKELLATLR